MMVSSPSSTVMQTMQSSMKPIKAESIANTTRKYGHRERSQQEIDTTHINRVTLMLFGERSNIPWGVNSSFSDPFVIKTTQLCRTACKDNAPAARTQIQEFYGEQEEAWTRFFQEMPNVYARFLALTTSGTHESGVGCVNIFRHMPFDERSLRPECTSRIHRCDGGSLKILADETATWDKVKFALRSLESCYLQAHNDSSETSGARPRPSKPTEDESVLYLQPMVFGDFEKGSVEEPQIDL